MAPEGLLYGSGREGLAHDKAGFPICVIGKWNALAGDEKKDQKRTELASKASDAPPAALPEGGPRPGNVWRHGVTGTTFGLGSAGPGSEVPRGLP